MILRNIKLIRKYMKRIASLNEKLQRMADLLDAETEIGDLMLDTATLVTLTREQVERMEYDPHEGYYVRQWKIFEDTYNGYLYYPVDGVPGQYVRVAFET